MKKIAVYGSLKRGRYNHSLLEDSKFIGETTVKGTLYSMGSYPALCDGDTEYLAEVYEVDEGTYHSIRGMELGAGYKEVICECYLGDEQFVDAIVYYADVHLEDYCSKKEPISSY